MLKRQSQSRFWPNALVFPGGVVEESDFARAKELGDINLAYALTAARETTEECGLVVPYQSLIQIAWWLTPESEPRRYDTRFFIAQAPTDQAPQINLCESSDGGFMNPSDLLTRFEQGEVKLAPPTYSVLKRVISGNFDRAYECICPEHMGDYGIDIRG